MGNIIAAIVLSSAFFLALILNLASKPSFTAKLTRILLGIAVVLGLVFYGWGFAEKTGSLVLTIVKTPFTVARMFVGVNDLAGISGTTPVNSIFGQVFFWMAHLLAFYTMASATMMTIGAEALRQLRFLLSRRGDLTIIYGLTDTTISLGEQCRNDKGGAVIFVTDKADPATVASVNNKGMSVFEGPDAVNSEARFVEKLHLSRRKLSVYALEEEADKDLFYAQKLLKALEKEGVDARNTRITLPGAEDIITELLQHTQERYGFGYVSVFSRSELAARIMVRRCPPWETLAFREDGRARDDFEAVIVGFGSCGQAVLKHLVMNGQYAGAGFKVTIFDPNYEKAGGYLRIDSRDMFREYDIGFSANDGRSAEFYAFIEEHLLSMKYIAITTGNEKMNQEISDNLMLFLKRHHAEHICVLQCGSQAVRYQPAVGEAIQSWPLFARENLNSEECDRRAIALNAFYDTSERSSWEKWIGCDSFSKLSSRASVDFVPAMLRAIGTTEEKVLAEGLELTEEQKQNLGETEHLRWCAFHYAMGYSCMSDEEFEHNATVWRRCKEEGTPCKLKIGKNAEARTHICLIPWEELDALSDKENAITGRNVDYKQLDINNVLVIPEVLRKEAAE